MLSSILCIMYQIEEIIDFTKTYNIYRIRVLYLIQVETLSDIGSMPSRKNWLFKGFC
jgi:hypothetical membrane protein